VECSVNTKEIGVIVAFTALTAVLNLVKIPVPFLPYFSYQLGDITLVIAFLLFGLGIGFAVVILSMIVSIAMLPSAVGIIGAPYYQAAVISMVLGVCLYEKLIKPKIQNSRYLVAKSASISTVISILTRTLIMLPLDYYIYGYLVSIVSGWSLTDAYALVLTTLPLMVIYNITVPLFAIPTSYYTAEKVSKHYKSGFFTKSLIRNNSGKQAVNVGSPFKPAPSLELNQANTKSTQEKT
jgi:riboflavin transporter FmnP